MSTWIRNLKISAKLRLMLSVTIVGMLIIGFCSFGMLSRMSGMTNEIADGWLIGVDKSLSADICMSDFRLNELRYVTATNETKRNASKAEMTSLSSEIQSLIDGYSATVKGDAAAQSYINAVSDRWREYQAYNKELMNIDQQGDRAAAMEYMDNQGLAVYNSLNSALRELADYSTQGAHAAGDDGARLYRLSLIGLALIMFVVIAFGLILSNAIIHGICVPLEKVKEAAVEMAQGNLDVEVSYESQDELGILSQHVKELIRKLKVIINDETMFLGKLADSDYTVDSVCPQEYIGGFKPLLVSFRQIADTLNEHFVQIRMSAEQVSNGAQQVANGSQALAQGSTEQASSVEELSDSINHISTQVTKSAEAAKQASDKADEVGVSMQSSNEKMGEMISAMSDISNNSSEIGKIIKTIDDIAFQTNILALNAAVEAARAGAAGKGFAVVANEVRNLASKSAEASKNTASLIESSIKAVENGTHIVDETAQSLTRAVERAQEATKIINQIAEASERQATSINQITQGIDQISSVVQSNSATSEQSAAASQELSSQAHVLQSLVSSVRLRGSQGSIPQTPIVQDSIPQSPMAFTDSMDDMPSYDEPVMMDEEPVMNYNDKY